MCHVWITGGSCMWRGRLRHNAVSRHDDEYLSIKSIWRIPPGQVQRVSKERGRVVGSGLSFCSLGFKKKNKKNPSDFKTQFPPWMKWCPPNCQVRTSNRPLCCPPPTMPCGSVPPPREAGWFSQNLSSTPWPVPCCRGRITGSCQSPARDKDRKGWPQPACFFFICPTWRTCFCRSLPVLLQLDHEVCVCVYLQILTPNFHGKTGRVYEHTTKYTSH